MATTYDAAKDPYSDATRNPTFFGKKSRNITKSDTVDLDPYPKAIVVTAAGNLVILPAGNTDDAGGLVTFTSAPVGFIPPYRVRRVHSTGTSATTSAIDD